MTVWSVYRDAPGHTSAECYTGSAANQRGPTPTPEGWSFLEPFRDPNGTVCMNTQIRTAFLVYLLTLQAIMIPWSAAIVRVAIKVVRGDNAEDVRSDDEDEEDEVEDEEESSEAGLEKKKALMVEEVGAEVIDFDAWKRRHGVKQTGRASGASISRHSDRKELLNRIGCERQID